MKTIIINASPRKNWNTAELLKSAQEGAKSVGADTEYIELYDLNFTGCHSCLACKLKNGKHPGCVWKDDLSSLIEKILKAKSLIIGTPIYFGEPTVPFRALMERLVFCTMPYQEGTYFSGKVNVGFIYTMNAPKNYYDENLKPYLTNIENLFKMALHGETYSYASCDTLQVNNYSMYDMAYFNEEHKKQVRETQFPKDLQEAFNLGVKLGKQ